MSMLKSLCTAAAAVVLTLGFTLPAAQAAEPEMRRADNLDELMRLVRERALFETEVNREREREFIERRDEQRQMLEDARRTRTQEEQRSERLETNFQENERLIG
jgi:biopolymer transport protein ExbB